MPALSESEHGDRLEEASDTLQRKYYTNGSRPPYATSLWLIYYKNHFLRQKWRRRDGPAQGAVRRGSEGFRRTSGSCRAGIACVNRSESGETGGTRLRPWVRVEPRDNAVDINGGGDGDMLQVGLRQAPISGPS